MGLVLIEALKFFLAAMLGVIICAYFEECRLERVEDKWRFKMAMFRDHLTYYYGITPDHDYYEEDQENDT